MSEIWTSLLDAQEKARECGRTTVPEHRPTAAVVACSDARVPPSVVFDQSAGSLFVVRGAGNTASPSAVASLDYAASELGVPLIIVLGHSNCGAVAAACTGQCDGFLAPLTEQICGVVADNPGCTAAEIVPRNVERTIAELSAAASPVGAAIRSGAVEIVGAVYDVATDELHPIERQPTPRPQGGVPS